MRSGPAPLALLTLLVLLAGAAGARAAQPQHFSIIRPSPDAVDGEPTTEAVDPAAAADENELLARAGPARGDLSEAHREEDRREAADGVEPPAELRVRGVPTSVPAPDAVGAGEGPEKLASPAPLSDIDQASQMKVECAECDTWFAGQGNAAWAAKLPPCPCTVPPTGGGEWHRMVAEKLATYFPGAHECVLSSPVGSHGQQCCYTATGRLITSGLGVGTPALFAAPMVFPSPAALHYMRDVLPFQACCRECRSFNCEKCHATYYKARPPSNGGCPAEPSPMSMPFCEPREHRCFEHNGATYIRAAGTCSPRAAVAATCEISSTDPCMGECVGADAAEVAFGCFCVRHAGASDVCVETVPLVRPLDA